MKSIQFIGTQRSGSNLLRVMLHQHPDISAPHPPHILQVMMPLLPMYGDLNDPDSFEQLVDDVCTLVEKNPVSWGIKFDRKEVAERCANHSLPQVMRAVYEIKALQKRASVWVCKSMASIHYVKEIEEAGLKPLYLWIYRDGRDVASSFMKAVVGDKHVYHLARQWEDEQRKSWNLYQQLGEDRCFRIRYEDLISDPEPVLFSLCKRLGINYSQEMLNYTDSEESKVTASSGKMWGNLVKPVMKNNMRKFEKELTKEEIMIFERVAGEMLTKLNYTLINDVTGSVPFTEEEIRNFDQSNKSRKILARAQQQEDMEKRKEQDAFISQLKERYERV